jgi:hypothetical protein
MPGKLIARSGIILISTFMSLSVYAQQQETPQHPQDFSATFLKAKATCDALWADHALDPLRDKFPLNGQSPTFAMLTDRTRLLARTDLLQT